MKLFKSPFETYATAPLRDMQDCPAGADSPAFLRRTSSCSLNFFSHPEGPFRKTHSLKNLAWRQEGRLHSFTLNYKTPILIPLLVALLPLPLVAQVYAPMLDPVNSESRYSIGLRAEGGLAANSLSNRFIGKFLFSDYLEAREIADQSSRLREENRLGGDYRLGLQGTIGLGENGKLWLGLDDVWHLDASVPASAFDLTFKGNKPFAGDTLQLAPAAYTLLRFQKLTAGWMFGKDGSWTFLATASYLKGERLEHLELESGTLYTDARGEAIVAAASGSLVLSDTNNKKAGAFNGHGTGIDLSFQAFLYPAFMPDGHLLAGAEVRDAGIMFWNGKTFRTAFDTLIDYRGIDLENPLQISDSMVANTSPDTLLAGFMETLGTGEETYILPGWLHVYAMAERAHGFLWGLGGAMRYGHHYKPYVYANAGYAFSENFRTRATAGYGGYGRFNVALGASYTRDLFHIGLNVQHLEAFIASRKAGGAWVGFSVTKGF